MLAGCTRRGDGRAAGAAARPTIVAGFYPLYEAAARVAGDRFEVVNLTPAGAEPHDLELTPDEVRRTLEAKVVPYLGGVQPALEAAAKERPGSSVDLLQGIRLRDASEGEELSFDPHVWLDPVRMNDVATRTQKVLEGIDPAHAADFARNGQVYRAELDALGADFRTGLAACARRVIVTSHAAFGYLAQRYGLEQEAISGIAPKSEPAPVRLRQLAALVKDRGVTTVFTETLVSPRTAGALAREAGCGRRCSIPSRA